MLLEDRNDYVELLVKQTKSHVVTTGIIVAIILYLTSLVAFVILLRDMGIHQVLAVSALTVPLPITIVSIIHARRSIKNIKSQAWKFIEFIEKFTMNLENPRVELLETPPPPFISIIRHSEWYIGLTYDPYRGLNISILEPFKTRTEDGYVPVYIKKSREILARREVNGVIVEVYKLYAIIPEPGKDYIVAGVFYSYEFKLSSLDPVKAFNIVYKILSGIKELRTGG